MGFSFQTGTGINAGAARETAAHAAIGPLADGKPLRAGPARLLQVAIRTSFHTSL